MKLKKLSITLLCSVALMTSVIAENEEILDIEDAPDAVKQTIESFIFLLPEDAKLDELSVENDSENTLYEAEIEVPGGIEYEIEMNDQGTILEIEMEHEDEDQDHHNHDHS